MQRGLVLSKTYSGLPLLANAYSNLWLNMTWKTVDILSLPFGNKYDPCFLYLFWNSLSSGIQKHVKGRAVVRFVLLAVGRLQLVKLLYRAILIASHPVKVGISNFQTMDGQEKSIKIHSQRFLWKCEFVSGTRAETTKCSPGSAIDERAKITRVFWESESSSVYWH
jgi:hypothetical protein